MNLSTGFEWMQIPVLKTQLEISDQREDLWCSGDK
jgi:hypothetical protein